MSEGELPVDVVGTWSGPEAHATQPPRPTVQWAPPAGSDQPAASPAGSEVAVHPITRLWLPRDVGIASVILGFPGGFGITARNAWRLGRRGTAFLHLLAGAAILLLLTLLPIPRALGIGVNFVIAYALYAIVKRQVAVVAATGGRVERAPGLAGVATFVGGWIVVAAPALAVAIAFGGARGIDPGLRGTIQFGTGGSDCAVDGAASHLAASAPMHIVAHLSREVKPGETIHETLTEQAQGQLATNDLPVTSASDCVSGTLSGGVLPPGSYTFEYAVGSERVATGTVVLTP
jgi:hypothetical protein